jgi:DNA invertase Pin-like site-specific DNA recombinase
MGDGIGYLRVSSRAQDAASQRVAVEKAAAARGDAIAEWFSEKRSGKALARPELDRLRALVRDGKVKTLYCFKLDRLTRSGVADTYRVVEEFRRAGCTLVAVADNLTIRPGNDDIVSETLVFALALAAPRFTMATSPPSRASSTSRWRWSSRAALPPASRASWKASSRSFRPRTGSSMPP